jgi:hypothetical protein
MLATPLPRLRRVFNREIQAAHLKVAVGLGAYRQNAETATQDPQGAEALETFARAPAEKALAQGQANPAQRILSCGYSDRLLVNRLASHPVAPAIQRACRVSIRQVPA